MNYPKHLGVMLFFLLAICSANGSPSIHFQKEKIVHYDGYRLHIVDIELLDRTDEAIEIKFTAINTGRKDIALGYDKEIPTTLVINFEDSASFSDLHKYKDQIRSAIVKQPILVKVGRLVQNNTLRFNSNNTIIKEETKPVVAIEETIVKDVEIQTEKPQIETPTKKTVKKKKDIKEKKKKVSKKSKKEKNAIEEEGGFTTRAPRRANKENKINAKKVCPDLIVEDIKILKKNKRWITLEYTIYNQGKGPASMLGESKSDEDNVAIRALISGTTKLTRGAIHLDGKFLKSELKNKEGGLLQANERIKGKIKLDITNKSRYTPIIIIDIDSFQAVRECNEGNNYKSIIYRK